MDPLSVTASVFGLVAAAGKAYALLETISSIQNAPTTIKDVQRETRHTEIALRSLCRFLQRIDPASERLEMIQVDELRVVLADAMLLFSSLESMLELLARLGRLRVAISWTKYSRQLDDHLGKLERYKSSLVFMLSILQCGSDSEARMNQAKLQGLVEQVLAENTQLRQKLQTSEDAFDARSIVTRRLDDDAETAHLADDNSTIRGPGIARSGTARSAVNGVRNSIMRFAFENILEKSRAYKRTAHNHECDQSIASSAIQSIFTGYSLADISVLSVIAMPFCAVDVSNRRHYIIQGELDLEALNKAESEMVNALQTLQVMEEPAKLETSSSDQATAEKLQGDSCSSEHAPSEAVASPTKTPDTSVETSSTLPALDHHHSHPASLAALDSALRGGSANNSSSYSDVLDDEEDDLYGDVYPCAGCGEILEEGRAFELGGNRYHVDCFRCNTCNTPLDEAANAFLLGDGSLICNNCTNDCSACGNKIEGLVILTGDQAFCVTCFRCRNCKRKIKTLRYARTSHGIFCMDCHESLMARRRKKQKAQHWQALEGARAGHSSTADTAGEAEDSGESVQAPEIKTQKNTGAVWDWV